MVEKPFDYTEILHRCFRCGYCKLPSDYSEINCPSYAKYRFESYFSGGRMWLIRAFINGEIGWSNRFGEIMYSCTTCRNCVENCVFKFSDQLVDVFVAARMDMVENGYVPPKVAEFFNNIMKFGNPWGEKQSKRMEWAEGRYFDGNEYLLYAGCVASYDDRARKALRALKELLEIAGVDFGVMDDETCEGNEVRIMGESGLFAEIARKNIERLERKGVRKILTPDPHVFNAFRNYYPEFGAEFDIKHHTQFLNGLIKNNKLNFRRMDIRATYHDPCFLARWNEVYREPRKILERIPGLILKEMPRNRKNTFCCGGGSGNFFTDYLGGKNSPARMRVREAAEIADVLITSCPVCLMMLEDAAKAENLSIDVKDISEVLLEAVKI
jgi:Fe-S oxidoreductase